MRGTTHYIQLKVKNKMKLEVRFSVARRREYLLQMHLGDRDCRGHRVRKRQTNRQFSQLSKRV